MAGQAPRSGRRAPTPEPPPPCCVRRTPASERRRHDLATGVPPAGCPSSSPPCSSLPHLHVLFVASNIEVPIAMASRILSCRLMDLAVARIQQLGAAAPHPGLPCLHPFPVPPCLSLETSLERRH